ncbi:hypothetical protein E2320_003704, partial [Naja naja]
MSPSRNSTFLPSLFQSFRGSSWKQGFESGSPERSHSIRFHFFCKDESDSPIQDHYISNNTLNIRTENLSSGQIKIICTCKIMERLETSGKWPYSPESNQLVFSVVGVPLPSAESGSLSQRVKEGDPWSSSAQLKEAPQRRSSTSTRMGGEFACSYEEKRSNRWIMSSLSQGVNITVEPESPVMEQSQLAEKKKERGDLGMMEPPAATAATASPV